MATVKEKPATKARRPETCTRAVVSSRRWSKSSNDTSTSEGMSPSHAPDDHGTDGHQPEHDEEAEDGQRHQDDLDRLGEEEDEVDVDPLTSAQRPGPGGGPGERPEALEGRPLARPDRTVADHLLVEQPDLLRQAGGEEDQAHAHEEGAGEEEQGDREGRRDLPRLGVDEQEDGEGEQQRQGPTDEAPDGADGPQGLAQGPPGHGDEAVAGDQVHHHQQQQVGHRGEQGRPRLSEDQGHQRREHDEQAQLDRADVVGPLGRPAAPGHVHGHVQAHQQGRPAHQGQRVLPPPPLQADGVHHLDQGDEREHPDPPGEDVLPGPVVLDEVGQAPVEEPPLGPAEQPLALLPLRPGHPRQSPTIGPADRLGGPWTHGYSRPSHRRRTDEGPDHMSTPTHRARRRGGLAVLVVLALVVGGCSSDDGGGDGGDGATDTRGPRSTVAGDHDGGLRGAARRGDRHRHRRRARPRPDPRPGRHQAPDPGHRRCRPGQLRLRPRHLHHLRDGEGRRPVLGRGPAAGARLLQIRDESADPVAVSEPFEVMARDDHAEEAFYSDQEIGDGFGYVTMRDGVQLSIKVDLPGPIEDGPYPTVVEYSGYGISNPDATEPGSMIAGLFGYATVGVNMRGTGCSGGVFDVFSPAQQADGYDAIEAIAAQPWVMGNKVGMVGLSYSGIAQLYAAATQPPSLAAITPLSVIEDAWQMAWPGGMYNSGFTEQWLAQRNAQAESGGTDWVQELVDGGDETCAQNLEIRSQNPDFGEFTRALENRPPDSDSRDLALLVADIDVPVFLTGAWQDEQTGPLFGNMLDDFDSAPVTRFTLFNGRHPDGYSPLVLTRWLEFLELYVHDEVPRIDPGIRAAAPAFLEDFFQAPGLEFEPDRFPDFADDDLEGVREAYEAEPDVRVLFENGVCGDVPGAPVACFETTFPSWPPPDATPRTWYLGHDGTLVDEAPEGDGAPTPSSTTPRPASSPSSPRRRTTSCSPPPGTSTGSSRVTGRPSAT